jgi:hypothetical protein
VNAIAASAGQPGLAAVTTPLPLPTSPSPALLRTVIEDRVIALLPNIATPAVLAAIHIPSDASAVATSVHHALEALANHDAPRALNIVTELIQKHPESVEPLLSNSALAPVHAAVNQIASKAHTEAAHTLTQAAILAVPHEPVLTLAQQFLDTGQYINYIRAAALGRLVIAQSTPAPSGSGERAAARVGEVFVSFWRRAPLLVMLFAWLLTGFFVPPALWATGFLGLVILQFVITIRNRPRSR